MFGFYRIATCVPELRVADPEFNIARILELTEKAADEDSSVILFPELAVTAYSCCDLFHNGALLRGAEKAVEHFCRAAAGLKNILTVGAPVRFQDRLFNAALVIQSGRILGIVPKTHLPNYREFSEKRYFSSGFGIRNAALD